MSIKKIITGLTLSLLLSSGVAIASDGNELLENCQTVVNEMDGGSLEESFSTYLKVGYCFGLIEGVRNAMVMYGASGDLRKDSFLHSCFPEDNIQNGQAARIITSYLKKNPAELNKNGSALAMFAFIDAYPCK